MPHHSGSVPDDTQTTSPPAACPVCGASDLTTTSKTVTSETYWRCVPCGEVWNVARRESSSALGFGGWNRGGNRHHGRFR